jgi:hypothetical protein
MDPLQYLKAVQEYLGILHNEFMLQRTLCRLLGNSTTELLRLSRLILSIVLEVGSIRSPHPAMSRYAPYININAGFCVGPGDSGLERSCLQLEMDVFTRRWQLSACRPSPTIRATNPKRRACRALHFGTRNNAV